MKTVHFKGPTYVGDPINAVKIFNEKETDELMVLDIDATSRTKQPDFKAIAHLAVECRMPLCYGGGVKTVEQVKRIVDLGVEKVAISSAAVDDPELVSNAAREVGSQSVVVVLDVKRDLKHGGYLVWTHNAQKNSGRSALEAAQDAATRGAGEVVINSIDNDGTMKGYDLDLARTIREAVRVPVTVLGGGRLARGLRKINRHMWTCRGSSGELVRVQRGPSGGPD